MKLSTEIQRYLILSQPKNLNITSPIHLDSSLLNITNVEDNETAKETVVKVVNELLPFNSVVIECYNYENDNFHINTHDIINYLEILPEWHYKGLNKISYEIKIENNRNFYFGQYQPKNKKIKLFETNNKEYLKKVLYHEIGHYVFYNQVKDKKKIYEWHRMTLDADEFVTEYASTNFIENFAENYSYYIIYPNKLKLNFPGNYDFFYSIFGGKEYLNPVTQKE